MQTPSNPSTTSISAGISKSWSHTSEVGKGIYVCIQGTNSIFFDFTFGETVDFDGVQLTCRARWMASQGSTNSGYVFTLPPQTVAKTANLQFIGEDVADYTIIAFNIECQPDADLIMFGGYYKDTLNFTFTRKALSWCSLGTQVTFAWAGLSNNPTLTGGVQLAAGPGSKLNTIPCNGTELSFTATRAGAFFGRLGMFSFSIPDPSLPRTSGRYQPVIGGITDLSGLAAGASIEIGMPYQGGLGGSSGIGNIMGMAGTIRSWAMKSSMPAGVNGNCAAQIFRGGLSTSVATIGTALSIPTGIGHTISGISETEKLTDGLAFGFSKFERLTVLFTNIGTAPLPAGFTITSSFLIETGVVNEQIYGGGALDFGSAVVDQAFYRCPLHPNSGNNWDTVIDSEKGLVGIPFTVTELIIERQIEQDTDFGEYFMVKNGIIQDGTAGTVNTKATTITGTMGRSSGRSVFSLSYDPGDTISIVGFCRITASFRNSATIRGISGVDRQIMISGHANQGATSDFIAQFNSPKTQWSLNLADEFKLGNIIPPMTITGQSFHALGLRGLLEPNGPNPGSTAFKFRKNDAPSSMPDLLFSGTETAKTVGGDVSLDGGDTFGLLQDATSNPALSRQFWTMPGEIPAPPDPPPPEPPPDGSGIYEMIADKRQDDIWINVNAGTARTVKIP